MNQRPALLLAAVILSSPAEAGYVITQTVTTAAGGKSVESSHVWNLDDGKFALTVTSEAATTKYVFNGKTLYACGALDPAQTDALKKSLTPAGQKQLDTYKTGACQVVPPNFMARFFLSPMTSVESVDVTDGLRLTLGVEGYRSEPAGSKKLQERDCSGIRRGYLMTRKGDDQASKNTSTEVEERFCQTPIPWRRNLWAEVAKAVLRQPGGKDLMKELKKDFGDVSGFTLEAEGTQGAGDAKTSFKLATVSLKETDFPAKAFQPPAGYAMFSPENLELLAAANAKVDAKTPGTPKKDEGSVLEFMQSAVFCAIAGKLGCFSN